MKRRIASASVSCLLLALFVGCGGDGGGPAPQREAVAGPLIYGLVEQRLREPAPSADAVVAFQVNGDGGGAADTAAVAGVIASFVPEAAPAMGAISAVATLIAGNQTAKQISALTQQVGAQQTEIDNIEATLSLAGNTFYSYVQSATSTTVNGWIYDYNTAFNAFQGDDGYYAQFLEKLGLPSSGEWPSGTTYATVAADATTMTNLQDWANSLTTGWMSDLQNLSTANVPVNCDPPCYKSVTQATLITTGSIGTQNAAALQLYQALYQNLQSYVPYLGTQIASPPECPTPAPTPATPGPTPTPSAPCCPSGMSGMACYFEQYNNELMSIYQQSVSALQQAYTIEATLNYLNYINGQNEAGSVQIPGIEDIPSIAYTFSNASTATEQQNLTNAQVALAQLYAARINQLYESTVQFIVTDQPLAGYTWPTPPAFATPNPTTSPTGAAVIPTVNAYMADHPYKSLVSKVKPASTIAGATGQQMPTIVQNSYMMYQYDGLNALWGCMYNNAAAAGGSAYTPLDATTCPPLFAGATGASWDGVNLSVYYGYESGSLTPALVGTINVNEASSKSPSSAFVLWNQDLTTGMTSALLPVSVNPSYPALYDQNGSLNLQGAGFEGSAEWNFTYNLTTTELATSPSGSWYSQSCNACNPMTQTIHPAKIDGGPNFHVLNQYNAPNGYIGAFYLLGVEASDPEYGNVGLTCPANDPFCTVVTNGICIGGNQLQIGQGSGSGCDDLCGTIQLVGTCTN